MSAKNYDLFTNVKQFFNDIIVAIRLKKIVNWSIKVKVLKKMPETLSATLVQQHIKHHHLI